VIRKHRLIEVFLFEVLEFGWDEVHEEAERLEHAVSDRLADRLDAYLGFPANDPHGDPIPTAAGELRSRDDVSLQDVEIGSEVEVVRVLDQGTEMLRYLGAVGVRPGAHIVPLEVLPFEGPIRIRVGDRESMFSQKLARRVLVRPK